MKGLAGKNLAMLNTEWGMMNLEALSKMVGNDPLFLFESYLIDKEGLSTKECRVMLEKGPGGSYKDIIINMRWDAWKTAWELAKRSKNKYQSKPEVIDKMIERLEWNDATKKLPKEGEVVLLWVRFSGPWAGLFWTLGYVRDGKWYDHDTDLEMIATVMYWAEPNGPGEIRSKT